MKSRTKPALRVAPTATVQIELAMQEVLADVRHAFMGLCVDAGRKVLASSRHQAKNASRLNVRAATRWPPASTACTCITFLARSTPTRTIAVGVARVLSLMGLMGLPFQVGSNGQDSILAVSHRRGRRVGSPFVFARADPHRQDSLALPEPVLVLSPPGPVCLAGAVLSSKTLGRIANRRPMPLDRQPQPSPDLSVGPGFRALGALLALAYAAISFVQAYGMLSESSSALPACADSSSKSRMLCIVGAAIISALPVSGQRVALAVVGAIMGIAALVAVWWLIRPLAEQAPIQPK